MLSLGDFHLPLAIGHNSRHFRWGQTLSHFHFHSQLVFGQKSRCDHGVCVGRDCVISTPISTSSLFSFKIFNIADNFILGSLPYSIGNWESSIVTFQIEKNAITGSLPGSTSSWTGIYLVDVSDNAMTSTIPDSVGFWSQLGFFDCRFNEFSGPLPPSIGNWSNLIVLNLEQNSFNQPIPETVGEWRSLQVSAGL